MIRCQLTEKQKDMLRSLVSGLQNNTVDSEWVIMYGGDGIRMIVGLNNDGSLWRDVWKDVKSSDFDDFVECDFFKVTRSGLQGPINYSLHKQKIIDAVEENFGENSAQKLDRDTEIGQNPRSVFVVHGRNELLRRALFDFLRSIGLKPLEWDSLVSRTEKGTPYIGEVLEIAFSEAQAIVVLMTPDDVARLRDPFLKDEDEIYEKQLTPQSRPNVIFEAGMAIGHNPNRTILVEVGKLRPFSDVAGRLVVRLDNSMASRQRLAQRLQDAKCSVDLTGIDWHTSGNFELGAAQITGSELLSNEWGKSGNIWWLFGDLVAAYNALAHGSKNQIDDYLNRCLHHAKQLNINDADITSRLRIILDEARNYKDEDWTTNNRQKYLQKIESIRNDAGIVMQQKQPGFKPNPD